MTAAGPRLLDPARLQARLGQPGTVVLEVVADDAPPTTGIPGAARAGWQALLWDERARALAAPDALADRLAALGAGGDDVLVLAGDPVQFGAYAFWALAQAGHPRLLLLDGGIEAWRAEGRPLAPPAHPRAADRPVTLEPRAGAAGAVAGRDDVRTLLGDPDALLLDARSPEEYRGERVSPADFPVDHGAVRAGRIPGARHLPHRALLDGRGRFLPAARLRTVAADAGATAAGPVVAYCRLGHRASLAWFALHELLGIPDVRVYDGSWTEWGSVVGVPIER